jgi:two-component system, chemotaxis family, chemotaxis protein CheY
MNTLKPMVVDVGRPAMDTQNEILILDEDPINRQRLSVRLSAMGFKIREAGDLETAKKLVLEKRPDLVIMEWGLKDVAGETLFHELRLNPSRTSVFTTKPILELKPDLRNLGLMAVFNKTDRYELLEHLEAISGKSVAHTHAVDMKGELEILVVDDSSAIRMGVRRALEAEFSGSRIREAGDGRKALTEMSQKKVDLIICDLEMPGMDGREFLKRVQANALLRRKPILVYSSNITADVREIFDGHAAVRFLHKPCEPARVVEAARRLMSECA